MPSTLGDEGQSTDKSGSGRVQSVETNQLSNSELLSSLGSPVWPRGHQESLAGSSFVVKEKLGSCSRRLTELQVLVRPRNWDHRLVSSSEERVAWNYRPVRVQVTAEPAVYSMLAF